MPGKSIRLIVLNGGSAVKIISFIDGSRKIHRIPDQLNLGRERITRVYRQRNNTMNN
jgi:hypothetical protein